MNTIIKEPKTFAESIDLLSRRLAGVQNLKSGCIKNETKLLQGIVQKTLVQFYSRFGADWNVPFYKILVKEGCFVKLMQPSIANVRGIPSLIFPDGSVLDIRKALCKDLRFQVLQESNNNIKSNFLVLQPKDKHEKFLGEIRLYLSLTNPNLAPFNIISTIENYQIEGDTFSKADDDEDLLENLLKEHTFYPSNLPIGKYTVESFGKEGNTYFMVVDGVRYVNYEFRHKQFVNRQNDGLTINIEVLGLDSNGFVNILTEGYEPTKYMTGFALNEVVSLLMSDFELPADMTDEQGLVWLDNKTEESTDSRVKNWLTLLKGQKYVPMKNKLFLAGYGEEKLRSEFKFPEPISIKILGVADTPITPTNNKPQCLVIEWQGKRYNLGNNSTTAGWLALKMLDMTSFDGVFIKFHKIGMLKQKAAFSIEVTLTRPVENLVYTVDDSDLEAMYF
jgi:hypothetical protein